MASICHKTRTQVRTVEFVTGKYEVVAMDIINMNVHKDNRLSEDVLGKYEVMRNFDSPTIQLGYQRKRGNYMTGEMP